MASRRTYQFVSVCSHFVPDLVFGCHAAQIWVDRCGGSSQSPEDCQQVREMREASQAMGFNSLRDLFPESPDDDDDDDDDQNSNYSLRIHFG